MSKNKDELNALKKEVENVNEKLHELSPEELEPVTGGKRIHQVGSTNFVCDSCKYHHGRRGNQVGVVIKCPKCNNLTFRGIVYFPRD